MDQGEGVEGAQRKEDPLDFALWKAHKAGEDSAWDAPWGRGRPGWHIECSAMAEGLLGVGFDIHGGGLDLLFPHHENEAAQTRCARGAELARFWMHNGMLEVGDGEKMAKSVGNIAPLHEALDRHGRDALILYFAERPLPPADRVGGGAPDRRGGRRAAHPRGGPAPGSPAPRRPSCGPLRDRFFAALADDFHTPRRSPRCGSGSARPTAAARASATATCARCSACSPSTTCSTPDAAAPAEVVALADERQEARAGRRLRPRGRAARARSRRSAGRCATPRTGPS